MAYQQPTTGIGSTAETNRLLGGNYLDYEANRIKQQDPESVANFKKANPNLEFGAQDVIPYYKAGQTITSSTLSGNASPYVLPETPAPKYQPSPIVPTPVGSTFDGKTGVATY